MCIRVSPHSVRSISSPQRSLVPPLHSHPSPSHAIPSPWKSLKCFPFHSFVIWRMLVKLNQTICVILDVFGIMGISQFLCFLTVRWCLFKLWRLSVVHSFLWRRSISCCGMELTLRQVWTALVHSCAISFHQVLHGSAVGWVRFERLTIKLYTDFWLRGGLMPLTCCCSRVTCNGKLVRCDLHPFSPHPPWRSDTLEFEDWDLFSSGFINLTKFYM